MPLENWEIIKNSIVDVNQSLGQPSQLIVDGTTYDIVAVWTNRAQDTAHNGKAFITGNQMSVRFTIPDGCRKIRYDDRIIDADNTTWVIKTIISGIYNQVRCQVDIEQPVEIGKRMRT